jgi:uncharacterized protein
MPGPNKTTIPPCEYRLEPLDSIRGFALCGILLANLVSFTGFYYLDATAIRTLPLVDTAVLFLTDWLVEGKFYAIFSMLLGAGFALLYQRMDRRIFNRYWPRRMLALLVIGICHLLFIWHGDILTLYSLLGFALLFFKDASQQTLLRTSLTLLLMPILIHVLLLLTKSQPIWTLHHHWMELMRSSHQQYQPVADLRVSPLAAEVFLANILSVLARPVSYLQTGRIPEVLAYFLVGIFLARRYLIKPTHSTLPLQLRWLLVPGLLLSAGYAILKYHTGSPFNPTALGLLQSAIYHAGAFLLALGYMGLLMRLYYSGHCNWLLRQWAMMGKMSLTHYLLQTGSCVVIFYGYGFALMGKIAFAWIPVIALAILLLQLLLGNIWLNYFSQGPIEKLWRYFSRPSLLTRHAVRPATEAATDN